jgi:BirA family transcriptional regulator, biotin operon repressor / biotin---[acetyl-CoA-carboxylase] ligase
MDQASLQTLLADLPLGSVRYFATVGSTNDLAARWAEAGAPDLSLVAADEQTAGRGRLNRRWITPPGSALAFSLILKGPGEADVLQYTALGSLAVCDALNAALPPVLPAQIKWPNDVIATRRKLAGVLAEAHWRGETLSAVILGIGINVASPSVPPDEQLNYPATCVEAVVESPVDRWGLLHTVLERLLFWRERVGKAEFVMAWGTRLAFRGEWVLVSFEGQPSLEGQVLGLTAEGRLRLHDRQGDLHELHGGELNVRPLSGVKTLE